MFLYVRFYRAIFSMKDTLHGQDNSFAAFSHFQHEVHCTQARHNNCCIQKASVTEFLFTVKYICY